MENFGRFFLIYNFLSYMCSAWKDVNFSVWFWTCIVWMDILKKTVITMCEWVNILQVLRQNEEIVFVWYVQKHPIAFNLHWIMCKSSCFILTVTFHLTECSLEVWPFRQLIALTKSTKFNLNGSIILCECKLGQVTKE